MTLSCHLVKASALEILIYSTKKKALDIYFDPANDLILLNISKNISINICFLLQANKIKLNSSI